MKKYRISAHTEPYFTYNTYPTWWRRLFNRPVVKTISYYHRINLVVESDVPLNTLKYIDGNVIGPFFEDITAASYVTTQAKFKSIGVDLTEKATKLYHVEPGATNLLINTASTFPK
jgi:hypothetical protein